ncbi:MAG: putative N-acetyltransferase YhbS [Alteromonadaceae bacterium]|jgi:predicted N-acetyltransferase YhbS
MVNNYQFGPLAILQLPLLNKFYKQQKARGKAKGNEQLYVARIASGEIVGGARLADISGCCFLTGVQVDTSHQRKGVAKALVKLCIKDLNESGYTFPYEHLAGLYQALGFVEVDGEDLPNPLKTRFARYQGQGRGILAMVYNVG